MELRDQRTVLSCLRNTANRRKSYKLRFLLKITATFCFFFALALNVHSQVTVSANLTDGTGATYRTAYLHFQLLNCGDNFPTVPSQPGMIVQDSFDIHPTLNTGLVTGTLIGNDQILCGNIASTWCQVTPMKDSSHPLRDGQPYVICASLSLSSSCYPGTGGTWNPLLAQPMTSPPPAPGFLSVYENPTLGQYISQPGGTSLVFQGLGSFDFSQLLQLRRTLMDLAYTLRN